MLASAFSYDLPADLVAQRPTDDREAARLLVVGPHPPAKDGEVRHQTIAELASLLPAGSLVVLNDTRVVRARLLGRKKATGGKAEVLLVGRVRREGEKEIWRAMGKASKGLHEGTEIEAGPLHLRLLGRSEEDGLLEVLVTCDGDTSVDEAITRHGHVPLPPYIKRGDEPTDQDRYQTVFARADGAIAAPTAGLHITRALLGRLAEREIEVAHVTLHVGLGTFQPVTTDDLDDHRMHEEEFEITQAAASAIARARERNAKVVAIGTTVVRALESAADPDKPGLVVPQGGKTRLLVQPGFRFRVVDTLVTNFHLPKSTLLALVAAFAGTERVLSAYRVAVRERYRFFSYGDAMVLPRTRTTEPNP